MRSGTTRWIWSPNEDVTRNLPGTT